MKDWKCDICLQDVHSQGEVIACLEKGLVREAEQQLGAHAIRDQCKKAIMRVAELSSDDFHLDRYLYFSCREDRERFCENVCFSSIHLQHDSKVPKGSTLAYNRPPYVLICAAPPKDSKPLCPLRLSCDLRGVKSWICPANRGL